MRILLARHGNTFGPGEKPVWVGRESDLPLVERGIEQAHAMAAGLAAKQLIPTSVLCGALRRTRRTAEIVVADLGLADAPIVDPRLNEIDYGSWAGHSSDEIASKLGQADAMRRWGEDDIWPTGAGWVSTEAEILGNIDGFLADLQADPGACPLVVSSNGIVRFVPRLLGLTDPRDGNAGSFRIRTGHMAAIARHDGRLALRCWDVAPGDLVA
jgi:broad specificity phosphatase PhoE